MSCESENNSYSSRYRQFSVSSPDILHDTDKQLSEDNKFKIKYDDLASLNEINNGKFNSSNLTFKLNKFGKLKLPQVFNNEFIYSSNNELFHSNSNKDHWINGVARYFKPILNYINKNPTSPKNKGHNSKDDNWEISFNEIFDQQEIGKGGQGIVYSGYYRGRLVAVKKMKEKNETEINYLKKLQHPNIVNFIGITTAKESYFIVMEYCSKGSLNEALQKSDRVTKEVVVDWSKQIAKGMKYLHDFQIVHRDLVSLNILITSENILKICDFGNCKKMNELGSRMSMVGTVGWMSPEMIRNEKCSEKIDIWSFGVVLWELIFCECPFKGLESHNVTYYIGNHNLKLPIPETCPVKYKALMEATWNIDPKKRPDFNQILTDLKIANKEFLSNFTNDKFIKIKPKWRQEMVQILSKKIEYLASKENDDNPMNNKQVQNIQNELQERLFNELLERIKRREEYLRKLGIKLDPHKSSFLNSLIRISSRNRSFKDKTSSLKLNRFVRGRSRRSYRLHYAQKQINKITTRDAETQTNFFNFDENQTINQNTFNYQYKAVDSGYGGESTTSCLSTPIVKHKSITTDFYNSSLVNNESKFNEKSLNLMENNLNKSFSNSSSNSSNGINRKHISSSGEGFRLHDSSLNDNLNSIQEVTNELPSGYLEASFENSLMLKKRTNYEFENNLKGSSTRAIKGSDTELVNNDEKINFSSEEDISLDSLNKYSEIYKPSDSLSSSINSFVWETNHQESIVNKSKLNESSSLLKPFNELKFENSKKMAAINDENESDETSLMINNSYVVIPTSKNETDQQNYIVLKSPTKDQLSKKNVRDSLLLYKNKGRHQKRNEQIFI